MVLSNEDKTRIAEEEKYRAEQRAEHAAGGKVKKKGLGSKKVSGCAGCLIILVVLFFALVGLVALTDDETDVQPTPSPEATTGAVESLEGADVAEEESTEEAAGGTTQYEVQVQGLTQQLTESSTRAGALLQNVESLTEEEQVELATHVVTIEGLYDQAKGLTPPPRYAEVHPIWLSAIKTMSEAMTLFREGIQEQDVAKITRAAEMMNESSELMQQATEKLSELE